MELSAVRRGKIAIRCGAKRKGFNALIPSRGDVSLMKV